MEIKSVRYWIIVRLSKVYVRPFMWIQNWIEMYWRGFWRWRISLEKQTFPPQYVVSLCTSCTERIKQIMNITSIHIWRRVQVTLLASLKLESLLLAFLITKLLHSTYNIIQSLENRVWDNYRRKKVTHTWCDLHKESSVRRTSHADHVTSSRTSKPWAHVYFARSRRSLLMTSGDRRRSLGFRVWMESKSVSTPFAAPKASLP